MSDNPDSSRPDPGLNPTLRNRTDQTHDTTVSSLAPADTASVQKEEGRAWPFIWAVVTLGCVAIAVWILIF